MRRLTKKHKALPESAPSRAYVVDDGLTGQDALELSDRLACIPFDDIDTLVLSLREVTAVDASGLAVLVRLYSRLMRAGKSLALRDIPRKIEAVLMGVGLGAVFVGRKYGRVPSQIKAPWAVRLPTRPDLKRPSVAPDDGYDPSIEELADAVSRLNTVAAVALLRRVVDRLGLTAERLGLQAGQEAADDGAKGPTTATPPSEPSEPIERDTGPYGAEILKPAVAPRKRGDREGRQPAPTTEAPATADRTARPAGAETERYGWAWLEFMTISTRLSLPPHERKEPLPREIENLLTDYLSHDLNDSSDFG